MTEHPLTDKKALSLFPFERLINSSHTITIEDAMRTAADWQLEQVIEWIEECSDCYDLDFDSESRRMIADLKQAMRPQQQQQQQEDNS